MLLKNMFENKKLNLNQPILSVRKYSPMKVNGRKIEHGLPIIPTRLPPTFPIKIAGAVPFQWEKTPGQPKQISDNHRHSHQLVSHDHNSIKTEESKSCNSGDCDEAFVDALDTLSRIESFLLNSCVGGPCLTGKDDLFLRHPQTLELMMDRFLPETKLVYASKKQSPVRQQQQRRLQMKIEHRNGPVLQYGHSIKKQYKEKEESDKDKDCDQNGYLLPNCGLRPRFCLKSSVCLVKPVPATNEYEVKSNDKIETAETKENKSRWKKHEKAILGVPEETKHAGIMGRESNRKTFQELLADLGSPKELDSGGFVVHKTVYVDTLQKLDIMRPFSPNAQHTGFPSSREQFNETNTQRMDQMHVTHSFLENFKKLNTVDEEAKLLPNVHNSGDFNIVSSSIPKTHGKWEMEMPKAFTENQDPTETENIEEDEKETTKNVLKQLPRSITLGNSGKNYSEFLVPPPLLKSPSDSWLLRTLSSVSTKNASRSCTNKVLKTMVPGHL